MPPTWMTNTLALDATSIARLWGSPNATPLDLVESLTADRWVGAALAETGLTETAVVGWRRSRIASGPSTPPDATRTRALAAPVDEVLTRALAAGPFLWSPAFAGEVARLLVTETVSGEVERLLADLAPDLRGIAARLAEPNLRRFDALVWNRPRYGVEAYRRKGVVVLTTTRSLGGGPRVHTWSATVVRPPVETAELGRHVVEAVTRRPGSELAADAPNVPFWEELRITNPDTFFRSSRLVSIGGTATRERMSQTRRERGTAWSGHSDHATPVSAFIDDPAQVGRGLVAAFDSSLG